MGLRDKRRELLEAQAERQERDAAPVRRFEYLARNLKKVPGMGLEGDLNEHGAKGWEAVCVADDYLVFKREIT